VRTLTTKLLTHSSPVHATTGALGTSSASAVCVLLEPWRLAGHDDVGHVASGLLAYESHVAS
jgi:hypothetical protein